MLDDESDQDGVAGAGVQSEVADEDPRFATEDGEEGGGEGEGSPGSVSPEELLGRLRSAETSAQRASFVATRERQRRSNLEARLEDLIERLTPRESAEGDEEEGDDGLPDKNTRPVDHLLARFEKLLEPILRQHGQAEAEQSDREENLRIYERMRSEGEAEVREFIPTLAAAAGVSEQEAHLDYQAAASVARTVRASHWLEIFPGASQDQVLELIATYDIPQFRAKGHNLAQLAYELAVSSGYKPFSKRSATSGGVQPSPVKGQVRRVTAMTPLPSDARADRGERNGPSTVDGLISDPEAFREAYEKAGGDVRALKAKYGSSGR